MNPGTPGTPGIPADPAIPAKTPADEAGPRAAHRCVPAARTGHRPARRVAVAVRSILFNVAAAAGAVCIVLVLLAWTFHLSLVMFRTGSMSPTIPAGSVALVKRIPAADARVGQIVTVDRPGHLPITHRVVSVSPADGGGAVLVLKGDANALADAPPYRVDTVREVIWHAPHLARAVVWVSQPLVIGTLTLLVAGLVTWTLWPSRDGPGTEAPATTGTEGEIGADDDRRDTAVTAAGDGGGGDPE